MPLPSRRPSLARSPAARSAARAWPAALAVALAALLIGGGCGGEESAPTTADEADLTAKKLEVKEKLSLSVREASGLALRQVGQQRELLAVGDADFALGISPAGSLKPTAEDLEAVLGEVVDGDGSQWEAVTVDAGGRIYLLEESPGAIVVLDQDRESVVATLHIEVPKGHELAGDWASDVNSRGEGLVLLRGGHVLLLKEKSPPCFVELGPAGDAPVGYEAGDGRPVAFELPAGGEQTLVPLKVWRRSAKAAELAKDLSDLAVGPDGELYIVSDESRVIARLESRLSVDEDKVKFTALWRLPSSIEKPEGLTIGGDFRPIVASDSKDSTGNAFVLGSLR